MRPQYWHYNGMLDGNAVRYTAVLTPHFLVRARERGYRVGGVMLRELVPAMWWAAITNECCGAEVGECFIYFKRKYNNKRRRWELELISLTPNDNFHTENKKFAVKVILEK